MNRGKYSILLPSARAEKKLERELKKNRIKVLGHDQGLFIVPFDIKTKEAIGKGFLSIENHFVDKISATTLSKLPDKAARVAKIWNWSLTQRGRKTTENSVKRLMEDLGLKIKDDKVYDGLEPTC